MTIYGIDHKRILKSRVELFINDLVLYSKSDPEVSSKIASYYCVQTNGCFEYYFRSSYLDIVRRQSSQLIYAYVKKNTDSWYNLKKEKMLKVISDCLPNNYRELKKFLEERDEFSSAVGSVVGNKNSLSHGFSNPLSWGSVSGWLKAINSNIDDFHNIAFAS